MQKKYVVDLTSEEVTRVDQLLDKGKLPARQFQRIHILLLAHAGHPDPFIAEHIRVGRATGARTREKFVTGGLDWALTERSRPGAPRKLAGKAEAFLVATACSAPPEGRDVWTMQWLADRLVEVGLVAELSDETVRRTLKKTK